MSIKMLVANAKDYLYNNFIWRFFNVESRDCILPTRVYIPKYYEYRMGNSMDLHNPKTISEKLNWLKVYYHDPLMTICADKYRMRKYVEKMFEQRGRTVPLLGKWDRAEDIDFDSLPNQFVLKTNHDDNPIICLDKALFDFESAKRTLDRKLHTSKYVQGREWSYKNIKRCIIAEEFIGDEHEDLVDYKFMCFNGEPKYIQVQSEHNDPKVDFAIDYYDLSFSRLPMMHNVHQPAKKSLQKPTQLNEMIDIARKLASFGTAFPFVRVDLYAVDGKIYVGELTFYPTNGMVQYTPDEWNAITGDYLQLPKGKEWKKRDKESQKWIREVLNSD